MLTLGRGTVGGDVRRCEQRRERRTGEAKSTVKHITSQTASTVATDSILASFPGRLHLQFLITAEEA